jgi:hypothetical protein
MLELLLTFVIMLVCFGISMYITRQDWKRNYGEIAAASVIPGIVALAVMAGGWYANVRDVNVLNGFVTSKTKDRVSCSHPYPCNCRKSGKSTHCDTCYLHPYDWDWVLHTNIKRDVVIDRIDMQGVREPGRYTKAQVGDAVALTDTYINYLKPSEHSLFNDSKLLNKYSDRVPEYPGKVYDYHYVDRVLTDKVALPEQDKWNQALANMVKELGDRYQVNTIVLFTSVPEQDYYNAVRQKWLGGKKNDVILIIGTPNFPDIDWVRTLSWTDNELFKVELQDDVYDLKKVTTPEPVMTQLHDHIAKNFVRKEMKDFDYLKDEVSPEPEWYLVALFMAIAACLGMHYWIRKHS